MSDDTESQELSATFVRNRGPNKRRIKPTFQTMQFKFGVLSDSEEDEDFVANSDDEEDYDSEEEDDGETQQDKEQSSSLSEEEDAGSHKDETLNVNLKGTARESVGDDAMNVDSNENKFKSAKKENGKCKAVNAGKTNKIGVLVCGICLETESTEEDELVECDGCGITVHEGCYGDTGESISENDSSSDAETEPWFCDNCKAKSEGYCELCPVKGGILKQTDTGNWVHLVCALYVPGAGFRDVDRLQTIVLDDIASYRWGSRQCILCEDQRFSRTGICIECDAGLCRTYFHVSCAQMNGLLTEAPPAGYLDDEDADPLYAHCKMHTDKTLIKARINGYLSFYSHVKNFKKADDLDEKVRIEAAFQRDSEEYFEKRKLQCAAILQSREVPRLFSSSPEICDKLIKKAEMLGFKSTSQDVYVPPTGYNPVFRPDLSCDFVNYFFKRDASISEYVANEEPLKETIGRNTEQQKQLHENLVTLKMCVETKKSTKENLISEINELHGLFEIMANKKLPFPEILKRKKKQRNLSETMIETIIHICATCNGSDNQHLMVLCDTCHNYYHMGCLDPPITTLPKKSRKWLWQCTECDKSESSEESIDEDGPATRKQKRQRGAPQKFTPTNKLNCKKKKPTLVYDDKPKKKGRPRKYPEVSIHGTSMKRGRPRKHKREIDGSDDGDRKEDKLDASENSTPKKPFGRKKKLRLEILDPCCVCSKDGDGKNMVRCDECSKCYHFDCCNPKLRSNPKIRGYIWECTECDNVTDGEEEDDGNGDDEEMMS